MQQSLEIITVSRRALCIQYFFLVAWVFRKTQSISFALANLVVLRTRPWSRQRCLHKWSFAHFSAWFLLLKSLCSFQKPQICAIVRWGVLIRNAFNIWMTSFFTVFLSRKLLFKGHFWISVHSFVLEGHTILVLIIDLLFALVFETYAGRAVWVVGELHKFMMCLAESGLDLVMLSCMMLVASSSLVMCQLIFVSLWFG